LARWHGVAAADFDQNPSHAEHSPGAIENFFDAPFPVDDARIQLSEDVAHVTHALEQLFA
jgi:hypothetical protein